MEKMPRYKIIVSDRARQMLATHVRFLAEKKSGCGAENEKRIATIDTFLGANAGTVSFSGSGIYPVQQVSQNVRR